MKATVWALTSLLGLRFLPALLVALGVIALGLLVRALANRYLPASQRPPRDLLTHEEVRLSEARRQKLDARRDEARAEMDRLMPPPGALGG